MSLRDGDDFMSGEMITDRYRVVREIGVGGMGRVYLTEHVDLEKQFALKLLLGEFGGDAHLVERFLQEARAMSQVNHEAIIKVTDFGRTPHGHWFYVMEYIKGSDLRTRLASEHTIPISEAREIALQICRGLEAAHRRGIIHCDIKPENILLVRKRHVPDEAKILDFGIARMNMLLAELRRRETGMVFGTVGYMSPEQAVGDELDERSDIYSVGCLLYEMLTGTVPFRGANLWAIVHEQQNASVEPPSRRAPKLPIPADLELVVLRALEKERDARFPNMTAMVEALAWCAPAMRDVDRMVISGLVRDIHLAIDQDDQATAYELAERLLWADVEPSLLEPHVPLLEWVYAWSCGDPARTLSVADTPVDDDLKAKAVMACVDGGATIEEVLGRCGLPQLDALRAVASLLHDGILIAR